MEELLERYENININDHSTWNNQTAVFARELGGMIQLARVITKGALLRDESRGAHYKPEFSERDDEKFLKTTKAQYDPVKNEPVITYEDVDISLIPPRKRDYSKSKEEK